MMSRSLALLAVGAALMAPSVSAAQGNTLKVPEDHPTIQAAVDAASSGATIRVGPGTWCGATVDKTLDLKGEGEPTIIGCDPPAPFLGPGLKIGFFLPTAAASGTTIRHFVFDGQGVSNSNLAPLSFGIFARDASNVIVEQNRILGTVQGITNTRGSGWTVSHNRIEGLTVFTCDGFCGGGDGIVFQARPFDSPRGVDNSATFNVIDGTVPDTLNEFSMTGILLIAQDGAVIKNNNLSIPDNPLASGAGEGIVVTDACCGITPGFLTSINSVVVNNDGRESEFSVVFEVDFGGGNGNSAGATIRGNFGLNDINGSATAVRNRSIQTLLEFP